jgi:PPOX class probable F420-dependent enzyme
MAAADSTQMDPTGLDAVIELARPERFLGVVSTLRADGTIQSSLLNVGVMAHPFRAGRVLALVTYGKVKLANLRARPQITVTFRAGWNWITVEGTAEIIGPTTCTPRSTPMGFVSCYERSSPRRAERMTTGRCMTK